MSWGKFKVGDCVRIARWEEDPAGEVPTGMDVGDVGYIVSSARSSAIRSFDWDVKFPFYNNNMTSFYESELELMTTK